MFLIIRSTKASVLNLNSHRSRIGDSSITVIWWSEGSKRRGGSAGCPRASPHGYSSGILALFRCWMGSYYGIEMPFYHGWGMKKQWSWWWRRPHIMFGPSHFFNDGLLKNAQFHWGKESNSSMHDSTLIGQSDPAWPPIDHSDSQPPRLPPQCDGA